MIYVYTSILNGWDNLRPPAVPPEDGVRFICFTNIPHLPRVHPWEYRPAYLTTSEPFRNARIPKILPHLLLPRDAQYSVYHDGNFVLKQSPCAIVDSLLANHDWAAYRHPQRTCVYEEADLIIKSEWASQELKASLEKEIARYLACGYPANNGLWANGFLVRRHTEGVKDLNEEWWRLYASGSARDQVSFPVARFRRDFDRLRTLAGNIYGSEYIQFRWHAAWKHREDNPDFLAERAITRERLERLEHLVGEAAGVRFAND